MERPRSILGLTKHLIQLRWQQIGERGRMVATLAFAAFAFFGLMGLKVALFGACGSHGCPSRARFEPPVEPAAAISAADAAEAETVGHHCRHGR